uniref:CSON005455 protein n=1 Tax=Culicoides sonorensis TaxID=179676 RepID=A0A336M018_CULSO
MVFLMKVTSSDLGPVLGFALESSKKVLIKDIIKNENSTISLNIIGCWDQEYAIRVAKDIGISVTYNENISLLNKTIERIDASQKLYVTDFQVCPEMLSTFSKIDKFFLAHPFRWLIFVEKQDVDFFINIDILIASNVVLAINDSPNDGNDMVVFKLQQVYKIKEFSTILRVENFGNWNQTHGLTDERSNKIISSRRKNMFGEQMTLVVLTIDNHTYGYFYNKKNKEYDPTMRMLYILNNIIMDTFNCTKRFTLTQRIGYDETGIWVGTYGNLINNHADLCLTPFFVLIERLPVIDYLDTLTPFVGYFIFRAPSLSSVANIYFLPFSRMVWISFGVSAVICTVSIFILIKWEEKITTRESRSNFTDVVLLTTSAICQMGADIQTKFVSSRLLIFFLFITFVFVYTSFTASIVGLLQSSTKSIQTLNDLLNSKIELGIEDNLYTRYYIGQTNDPVRLEIYNKKIAPPGQEPRFYDRQTGVAMMRNSSFAFFGEPRPIYREIQQTFFEEEKCGLNQMEYLEIIEPYQAVQKNSPIKEMAKVAIMKLREYAITKVEIDRILTSKPICAVGNGQRFESVSLESFYVSWLNFHVE